MNIFLLIVFLIGCGLSFYMEFTQYSYSSLTDSARIAWRVLMAIPLIGICAYNAKDGNPFNYVLIGLMVLVLIADIFMIKNFTAGLIAFGVIHLALGLFLYFTYSHTNLEVVLFTIFLIGVGTCLWLTISTGSPAIKIVLFVYVMIMMFTFSRMFAINLQFGGKTLLLIGYALFILTDYEVAWMVFNGRFNNDQILNNVLYYGALGLITLSGWEA